MKKLLFILSAFLFYLNAIAQVQLVKEFNAVKRISTEFEGIKIGTSDMGKQLLNRGFVECYVGDKQYYKNDKRDFWYYLPFKYISVLEGYSMEFITVFNSSNDINKLRTFIWERLNEVYSPNEEKPLTISDNLCYLLWRDKFNNSLLLRFDGEVVRLAVVPASGRQTVANLRATSSHEYVDLGLSVKWATCNVGASRSEEYGDYFAWGETSPKSDYSWTSLKYRSEGVWKNVKFSKYVTSSKFGTIDNKNCLDLSDDAAYVKLGSNWRIPTSAEFEELINKCTWTWTTLNGKNGYKIVSKANGNSIFLPASGCRYGDAKQNADSEGYYWTSSLTVDSSDSAYDIYFKKSNNTVKGSKLYRFCGLSIRPVCP